MNNFSHPGDQFWSSASVNCKEPIIFHYTQATGALGILESKQIWCTSIHHSNDKQELKEAFQVVKNVSNEEFISSLPDVRQSFIKHLTDLIGQISKVRIYIACFSEAEDLLSQWRGYANPRGYNLGFSLKKLQNLSEQQGLRISKVIYDHSAQKALFVAIVRSMAVTFQERGGITCDNQEMNRALWPFATQIAKEAPLVKHKSFAEEKEWRIFSDPFSKAHENVSFVVRNNDVIPVYKLNLPCGINVEYNMREDIAFRSFMVGPGGDEEDRMYALQLILDRYNIFWRLGGNSQVPLREKLTY